MIDDDLQQKVNQKLADATSQIVAARAREFEEGSRLTHRYGATYGIGLLVLGCGAVGLAFIFRGGFSYAMPITLGIAFFAWAMGAIFIQMPNWLRRRLARRLLKHSPNR